MTKKATIESLRLESGTELDDIILTLDEDGDLRLTDSTSHPDDASTFLNEQMWHQLQDAVKQLGWPS